MKNKILFFLFITLIFCLSFFIQVYIISGKTLFGVKPNILLISVIVLSTFIGIYKGTIYGFILGIICDFLYGSEFGIFTISYTLVAIIIGVISSNYRVENKIVLIIMTFLGTFTFEFIEFIIYSFFIGNVINIFHLIFQTFLASILNMAIVFILNGIVLKVAEKLEIKKKQSESIY